MPRAMVALLFSDIEGSTRLLQQLGPQYAPVLLEHRRRLRAAYAEHAGEERGIEGDSFFVTFPTAADAVAASLAGQRALSAEPWPADATVRVRMGVHVGPVEFVADSVIGLAVHEAARIASAAHGGQVLVSEAAASLAHPMPPGTSWLALGPHQLKDVPDPVGLMQLAHPDLGTAFPAPRTIASGRNNLPSQASSFIGRSEEITAIENLLAGSKLVTITGTGGVGKTRIALRVAASQGQRYRDGVWLVDLTKVSNPASVKSLVATTLLGEGTDEGLIERLAEQSALLVLDNCEHVLDAVADLVSAVLSQCPDMSVLTTSREPIGIAGETVWRVPPMRTEEAVELLTARARQGQLMLTEDSLVAVREVCERLDTIPLAIELAAARLGSLTIEQVATRLDNRFRLLAGGSRGSLERHRTLQSTLDWSYELLEPAERGLLRRLGVFTGGFDLAAAEAIETDLDPDEVLDLLDRLVRKSLVVAEERGGSMRFRLLETIRQYAIDQLVRAGELAGARDAHLVWALGLTRAAENTLWLGGDDEAKWLDRLDDEDANLRAAIDWAFEQGAADSAVWLLFGAFGWMTARGRSRDGLAPAARALRADLEPPESALAKLLLMCFESNAGRVGADVVAATHEAAPALSQTRHRWLVHVTRSYTTAWSYSSGDSASAAACIEPCRAAVDAVREYGPGATAWCLQPLVWVTLDAGRVDEARAAADEAITAAVAAKFSIAESRMTLNRARIALAADELEDAWDYAERSIVAARRTGELFVVSAATQLLADVAQRQGDRDLARDLLVSILDAVAESQPQSALTALRERIATYA